MNREPIYHKDGKPYRVVSKPNGKWTAQIRVTEAKGWNADNRLKDHFDPWQDLHGLTTKDEAVEIMYSRMPLTA